MAHRLKKQRKRADFLDGMTLAKKELMKSNPTRKFALSHRFKMESGKVGWILLWLIGVPLPILLLIYFLKGCH